jgi:aldehyde:ferredoxin oxidoreductase
MQSHTVSDLRKAHQILVKEQFEPKELQNGYASRYLRINLSSNLVESQSIDQKMKDLWTGGKGFDLWITFKEINKDTKWNSPENPIVMSSGPIG